MMLLESDPQQDDPVRVRALVEGPNHSQLGSSVVVFRELTLVVWVVILVLVQNRALFSRVFFVFTILSLLRVVVVYVVDRDRGKVGFGSSSWRACWLGGLYAWGRSRWQGAYFISKTRA
jgi:hypothetical protein